MSTTTSFAKNLVYIRQHYGVTQETIAEQLGVSRQTVSKWEAGINFPETDKMLVLCDLYHTNLDDLMRGSVEVGNTKDTALYDAHMNRFGLSVAAGVALILVGVAVFLLLGGLSIADKISLAVLLSFIVIGTLMFIVSGLLHAEFRRKHSNIAPFYAEEVLGRFGRRFTFLVASGIGIILLGVILFIAILPGEGVESFVFGTLSMESLALAILLLVIALGVGLIIYAGMQKSKYDLTKFTQVATSDTASQDVQKVTARVDKDDDPGQASGR
jgi:transcriptional regulator with XRE-family HTH domain